MKKNRIHNALMVLSLFLSVRVYAVDEGNQRQGWRKSLASIFGMRLQSKKEKSLKNDLGAPLLADPDGLENTRLQASQIKNVEGRHNGSFEHIRTLMVPNFRKDGSRMQVVNVAFVKGKLRLLSLDNTYNFMDISSGEVVSSSPAYVSENVLQNMRINKEDVSNDWKVEVVLPRLHERPAIYAPGFNYLNVDRNGGDTRIALKISRSQSENV